MIKIGLIGSGRNGTGHLKRLKENHSDRCEIAGIADPNIEAAQAAASEYGGKAYAEYTDMLSDVDAVFISSPNFLHVEQAVACAEAGKHVFVEKPMALTIEDAEKIEGAVEKAGVASFVGFSVQFGGTALQLRNMCRAGDIGDVFSVWSRRMSWSDPGRGSGWRSDFDKVGGVIHELMVHEIDWVCSIAGMPESVYCQKASVEHRDPRENDHIWLTMKFGEEKAGTVEGSTMARIADYYRGACGTTGSLYTKEWGGKLEINRGKDEVKEIDVCDEFDKHANFLDACEGKGESAAPVSYGRKIVTIAVKAIESAIENKVIDLQLD